MNQQLNTMIFQDKAVSISTTFKGKALRAEFKPYRSSVVMDFWKDNEKIDIKDQDEDEQCLFVRMVKEYLKSWCK